MTYEDGRRSAPEKPMLAFDAAMVVFAPHEQLKEEGLPGEVVPDPPPQPVQVEAFRAACERNDHDPALGGFLSWGGWWGPEHFADAGPAVDQAQADANTHFDQTGHGEVMVTAKIHTFFVGPVV
ncbi:MAG TPA: hypothetical protein VFU19_07640 [Iamia sp.]|nr:hypothetical protein [Iamia sp.]